MAAGDITLTAAQTRAQYIASSTKLVGEAFDAVLDVSAANSNILDTLQGPEGSDKPFIIKRDLEKGRMDTVNFNVAASLGQSGRRGLARAVNYEEPTRHNTWPVTIDTLRVVVGWNELTRQFATTGATWQELYPQLCGDLVGRIEQEDMLMRLRQRATALNTVRPGNRASLNALRYDDTLDTDTLGRGYGLLTRNGAKPASLGKMTGGMELKRYVALGANIAMEGLWQDPTFTEALKHAGVDGPSNPFWTNDLPDWRGMVLKRWDIVSHDNPGANSSSIMPEAILGDASATASGGSTTDGIESGTTTFDIYGGGVLQSALGDSATLYKPFEYFYGATKLFGETLSTGTDAGTYYFLVIDPADGKWNIYSYVGSTGIGSNGYKITTTARLHSSTSGVGYTTLKDDGFGGSGTVLITYSAAVNKVAFPVGSIVVQCNIYGVPVCDTYLFGANAAGKCYGMWKNERINNKDDYGELNGVGVKNVYGSDVRKDVNGLYHRGFVRIQSAYTHPLGGLLPQI